MASTILVDRWQRHCNHVQDASRVPADFCGLVSKEERTTDLLDLEMADKSLSLRAPNGCPNLEEDEKVRDKEFGEAMLQRYVEILVPHNHHQEYLVIIGDWWSIWYYLILGFWFHFVFLWIYSDHIQSILRWNPPKNMMRIWFSSPGLMHCLWYLQQEG